MTTYMFNRSNDTLSKTKVATALITSFFGTGQVVLAKPQFKISGPKQLSAVTVQIVYYSPLAVKDERMTVLGNALSEIFHRSVELRLIRLNSPFMDSHVLAQVLAAHANKLSFNRLMSQLNMNLPKVHSGSVSDLPLSEVTGLRVKLSGRLTTQRHGPRQTVSHANFGSKHKFGQVDFGQFTAKNKLGSFTIKVWICHNSRSVNNPLQCSTNTIQ